MRSSFSQTAETIISVQLTVKEDNTPKNFVHITTGKESAAIITVLVLHPLVHCKYLEIKYGNMQIALLNC